MLFFRIPGFRKTCITPSKLFIKLISYSSFDSEEFVISDTMIKKNFENFDQNWLLKVGVRPKNKLTSMNKP